MSWTDRRTGIPAAANVVSCPNSLERTYGREHTYLELWTLIRENAALVSQLYRLDQECRSAMH